MLQLSYEYHFSCISWVLTSLLIISKKFVISVLILYLTQGLLRRVF